MKNTLLSFLLIQITSFALPAQSFEHYYDSGQEAEDLCFSATSLSDDRIAVAAFRRIANGSSSQSVLFFTDALGNLDTLMLGPDNRRNSSRWIQEISNDRLLLTTALAPTLNSRAEDWSFTIFDNAYNTIDRKSFGTPGNDEQIRDVIVLDNGNIAVCGELGDGSRTLITLFDENLNFIWRRSLVAPGSGRLLYTSVQATDDGFVVGGHEIPNGNSLSLAMMARYTSDGDLLWSNQYTNPGEFSPHGSEVFIVGENYLMLDEVQRNGTMMLSMLTIDPDGEVVSYGYFDGPETSRMQDAIQLLDGSFVLVGYTVDATDKRRGMIVRLTAGGSIVWSREYEREESLTFSSISPRQGGDGGFIIGGYGEVCGRSDTDVVLLTVDDEGLSESECAVSNFDLEWIPSTINREPMGTAANYSDQDGLLLDLMAGSGSRVSFFCPVFRPDPDLSSGTQSPLMYTIPESCSIDSVAIVDSDASFVSTGILDSFVINLITPVPADQLIITESTTFTIRADGNQRITIIGPITTGEIEQLLQRIIIDDETESFGGRTLEMTAFAGCEVSPVANGFYRATGQESVTSTLPDTLAFCPGEDVLLSTGLPGNYVINWNTGEAGDNLMVADPGQYSFTAASDCNELMDTVVLIEQDAVLAPFNDRSLALCLGDTIALDASVINASSYGWDDDSGSGAIRQFYEAGSYVLTASTACDTASYQVVVTTENCCEIYIPNAFSPNADGINDQFRPESGTASCNLISDWSLRVYDRWGGEVFETSVFGMGWDGRRNGEPLDPGVYAYVLEYFDGLNQRKEYGDITLLR